MLAVLASIAVASFVKTLRLAMIAALAFPVIFGIASFSFGTVTTPNPIGLILSLPLSLYAAYLTFNKCEKRRQSIDMRAKAQKITAFVGMAIVCGMLAYLAFLVVPMVKLNLG